MQEYVVGFVFDTTSRSVLLQKKKRPEWQKNLFNGFGGKIKDGEFPLAAMYREFKEEIGDFSLHFNLKLILVVIDSYGNPQAKIYFYSARVDGFNNLIEMAHSSKITHDEECEIHDCCERYEHGEIVENLRWIIPFCAEENTYSVPMILWYQK